MFFNLLFPIHHVGLVNLLETSTSVCSLDGMVLVPAALPCCGPLQHAALSSQWGAGGHIQRNSGPRESGLKTALCGFSLMYYTHTHTHTHTYTHHTPHTCTHTRIHTHTTHAHTRTCTCTHTHTSHTHTHRHTTYSILLYHSNSHLHESSPPAINRC